MAVFCNSRIIGEVMIKENITAVEYIILSDESRTSVKVTTSDGIISFVPMNEENSDYVEVLEWEAIDGNTIAEAE
jgi:hypothetical protein|tara:strand:+ start:315 stop:539 length:225 start_codon:yes stop_codon:yes gene_type:complete